RLTESSASSISVCCPLLISLSLSTVAMIGTVSSTVSSMSPSLSVTLISSLISEMTAVNCSVNSSDASTSTVLISSDESNKFMILSKFPPSIISSITMMVVMMNDFALTLDKYVCQKVVLNLFILTTHLRNEDIVQ